MEKEPTSSHESVDQTAPPGEETPHGPITQPSLGARIDVLVSTLQRAYPNKPPSRFERAYRAVQTAAKYIGIPALLIAAVSPVTGLVGGLVDSRNNRFIEQTYASRVISLLDAGEISRAGRLLADLEASQERSARIQYLTARTAAFEAIRQGTRHQEAEDQILLLLEMQRRGGVLFPRFGGKSEMIELELGLIDIDTQLGRYQRAIARIDTITVRRETPIPAFPLRAHLALRRGTILVLQYEYADAVGILTEAANGFAVSGRPDLTAEARFQLAKAHQFQNNMEEAIVEYQRALDYFEASGDEHGTLRVANNLGMIHLDRYDLELAQAYYTRSESSAQRVGDQLGIARAANNLAIVQSRRGDHAAAITESLRALAAFEGVDNRLGMAASHQQLANSYFRRSDEAQALHHASRALFAFEELREPRGAADASSVMGDLQHELDRHEEEIYYQLYALLLRRHIQRPDTVRNIRSLRAARQHIGQPRFDQDFESAFERASARAQNMVPEIDATTPVLGY